MFDFLKKKSAPIAGALWLDLPDAHRNIDAKLRAGAISAMEAEGLRHFSDEGYLVVKLPISDDDARTFDAEVDRLWKEKPHGATFAYDSPPLRFDTADEATQRKPRYRIHDLHSRLELARRLYLDGLLSRYASLIIGEESIATQSLYFEYGSQQTLHRDSIVVPTPVFGHLVAAWIALEDIDPRSGALAYVPGSHKLPYFEFRPGLYEFDPHWMGEPEIKAAVAFHEAECAKRRLTRRLFEAKRGEVLIWHAALLHGGGPVADDRLTRKSYVVHYSSRAHQKQVERAVVEPLDGVPGESVYVTSEVLEQDGAVGFANALDGTFSRRL